MTQAAAAYAAKKTVNDAAQQAGSPKMGDEQEAKPAGVKEWLLRLGAVGNCEFISCKSNAWLASTLCRPHFTLFLSLVVSPFYTVGIQAINIVKTARPDIGLLPSLGSLSGGTTRAGKYTVFASSGLGAVHSPAVMVKERQITKEDTFRTALNGIREEQSRLAEENEVLSQEIDALQSEVDRMNDIEMALRELSETQGSQLSQLMDLIRENKEINEGMRFILKAKAAEQVISLVLDIDNDGSFTIQDKEIDRLIIGMKLLEGVSFDEGMFREDLAMCGGSVDEVIVMIKSMFEGEECAAEYSEMAEPVGRRKSIGRCTINIEEPENFFKRFSMTS